MARSYARPARQASRRVRTPGPRGRDTGAAGWPGRCSRDWRPTGPRRWRAVLVSEEVVEFPSALAV